MRWVSEVPLFEMAICFEFLYVPARNHTVSPGDGASTAFCTVPKGAAIVPGLESLPEGDT